MKKIIISLCSLLLSLVIMELIFRVVSIDYNDSINNIKWDHWQTERSKKYFISNYKYDKVLGFEKTDVYETIIKLKDETKYKILVLGDSVSQEGTYIRKLERLLSLHYDESSLIIVNAGVVGYNLEMEYKYLIHRGIELNPDLVILQFNPNDFTHTPVIIRHKDGKWLAFDKKKIYRFFNPFLFARSNLYKFIMLKMMKQAQDFQAPYMFKEKIKTTLDKMQKLLYSREIPLVILYFPALSDTPSRYYVNCNRIFYKIIEETNLHSSLVDITKEYPIDSLEKIAGWDPCHFNEKGNDIAATVLFKKLVPLMEQSTKLQKKNN